MKTSKTPKMDFKSAISEIFWSWQPSSPEPHNHPKRGFDIDGTPYIVINKLCITPTEVSYKTSYWELEPNVFDRLNKFIDYLEIELEK